MSVFACPNGHVEAVECQSSGCAASRKGGRPGRAPSVYCGMRVRITGGPRAGQEGVIFRLHNGQHFEVDFDDGRHYVGRHLVEALDGTPLPGTRKPLPVAQRVAELHTSGIERVVVYRTNAGYVRVAPWREQEVGPGLIGVYARGVDPAVIEGDL